MSAPSLAPYIVKRPWLKKWITPLANWYANAAGYRQLGLRADDLLPEENDVVQIALNRLGPQEAYDRVFRLRRAIQLSMSHQLLPKEEWTKPDEDRPYLSTIMKDIEAEMAEREDLESMIVSKRAKNAAQQGH
ncbi:hypothetical protein J1614_003967 [Plenodomus biglobosus]|nr:hypothetical protein J1614_003967 [Plenodomus biglobosus]